MQHPLDLIRDRERRLDELGVLAALAGDLNWDDALGARFARVVPWLRRMKPDEELELTDDQIGPL